VKGLESAVEHFRQERTDKAFATVLTLCSDIFAGWYRGVQRFTNLDRQQLLSEFQLLVLRAANKYDPMAAFKWNGFECYLRSASKKLGFSLRRKEKHRMESLPSEYDAPDPKAFYDRDFADVIDALNTHLDKHQRNVVVLKAMGNDGCDIRKRLSMSDYYYRETVRNIRSNEQLKLVLSSVK
jgi:hypothetical protein